FFTRANAHMQRSPEREAAGSAREARTGGESDACDAEEVVGHGLGSISTVWPMPPGVVMADIAELIAPRYHAGASPGAPDARPRSERGREREEEGGRRGGRGREGRKEEARGGERTNVRNQEKK